MNSMKTELPQNLMIPWYIHWFIKHTVNCRPQPRLKFHNWFKLHHINKQMMSICIQWINCVQLSSNMKALTRNVKFKTPSCFCKSNAHKQWKELLNSTSVTTLIFFFNSMFNIKRQFMAFANFVSTNGVNWIFIFQNPDLTSFRL